MEYHYRIYGIAVVSTIELPDLVPNEDINASERSIHIKTGLVPAQLSGSTSTSMQGHHFSKNECILRIPAVASYHIFKGEIITIEQTGINKEEVRTFCYNYAITALLLQRNIILLHVSGVYTAPGKVLLMAAASGTGKSTTAIMLGEKGYKMFTDDTAMLTIEGNTCFAIASYPQTRLWQNSVEVQNTYKEEDKRLFKQGVNKYAFSFVDDFSHEKVEVTGIVFLEKTGESLDVRRLKHREIIQDLDDNIYARRWINAMKKNLELFQFSMQIANTVPCWKATRPKETDSFQSFAEAIIENIIYRESLAEVKSTK